MPNPKLPLHLKRRYFIKVSVNEAELATIKLAKHSRKSATWIREAVIWAATQNLPPPEPLRRSPEPSELQKAIWTELAALRTQIAGLGRNANQIALKLNRGSVFDGLPILIAIDRNIAEIKKTLILALDGIKGGV